MTCRDTYESLINKETMKMHETLFDLQQRTTYHEFEAVLKLQCGSQNLVQNFIERNKRNCSSFLNRRR